MKPYYEWLVEILDEHGDVIDVDHFASATGAKRFMQTPIAEGRRYQWGVVRTDEMGDREWAYVEPNGMLPTIFDDMHSTAGSKVPQRFHKELFRA